MKKNTILLLCKALFFFSMFFFLGCKKEPDCEKNKYGSVTFIRDNMLGYLKIEVYVDNEEFGFMYSGGLSTSSCTLTDDKSTGSHTYKTVATSTTNNIYTSNGSFNIDACEETIIHI